MLLLTSITPSPAGAANLSWVTRASMPTVRSGLGVAAANNGKVYAIGGTNGVNVASVEEYNPGTDTWATRTSMPTARSSFGVAAAGNGKIYAIGGNFSPLSTVEEYDPGTDTWATRTSMPTARRILAAAAASNGKVYAVGGIIGLTSPPPTTGLLEEYDPGTDTWATRTSMPTARYCLAFAAASNGKLYAVGGVVPVDAFSATVEEYDPGTDTWATRANMPTARGCPALVAASNGKLYAIGGVNSTGELNTVDEYDPATDTWTAQTSMAFARQLLGAAAASNGKLYAIGGQNGGAYLATNEEATTAVPFTFSTVKVEIEEDEFEVKATFTLGAGSDGLDIPTEIVSLQLTGGTGAFSATIPAGSFEQDEEGEFKFEGIIDGVSLLEVKITSLGNGDFEFKAEGEGADLTGMANPVTIVLTIGNDSGTTTVEAEFE